jgi:hypothetical protein
MVISNRLHKHELGTDILSDLLNLELPEMSGLDLDLAAGHRNNAVLGGFNALADFLAFTYIDFHGFSLQLTYESHGE